MLKDRPPAPGEQGAIPVALEIIAAATPLSGAFLSVLKHWIDRHKVSVKVRLKDGRTFQFSGGDADDAARLFAQMVGGNGAATGHGD
jgi:hypothetical protein